MCKIQVFSNPENTHIKMCRACGIVSCHCDISLDLNVYFHCISQVCLVLMFHPECFS